MVYNFPMKAGTAGGTLSALLMQIRPYDLVHTALVAGVGAGVSFIVSTGLKWVWERWRKRR
jgi:hypothetical protein